MAFKSHGIPDLEGLLDRLTAPGAVPEIEGGDNGIWVSGSAGMEEGCNKGVVAAGDPAGERVTAGISDTRRLCPDAVEGPKEGEAAGGTGSLSAAERSIGDWDSTLSGPVIGVSVVRFTVSRCIGPGALEVMTVITLPSLMS